MPERRCLRLPAAFWPTVVLSALALPALAQQIPPPTFDARDKLIEIKAGSTLRNGEGLADRIEYTIWQTRTLKGAGTCSSQACPVHFNGEVLFARRSRVTVVDPSAAAQAAAVTAVRAAAVGGQIKTTLRRGDKGSDVRRLQDILKRKGLRVDIDGRYGKSTLAAVRDFQRKQGLKADGVAGPATLRALGV